MPDRRPPAPGISVEKEQISEEELRALGVDLERDFPGESADDFRRYPVLSEGGWLLVVKNQRTLRSVSREPWDLYGPVKPLSYGLMPEE
jgi:hypothetical protein